MARTAVIDPATNLVVNAIEAGPAFTLDGFTLVASDTAGIGDTYDPKKQTFMPAPAPPVPVPSAVTNYQARAALISAGLFDKADTAVRNSGNAIAVQAWDYANQFFRNSPIVAALGGGLDLTDAQIDDLFRAADKVV